MFTRSWYANDCLAVRLDTGSIIIIILTAISTFGNISIFHRVTNTLNILENAFKEFFTLI